MAKTKTETSAAGKSSRSGSCTAVPGLVSMYAKKYGMERASTVSRNTVMQKCQRNAGCAQALLQFLLKRLEMFGMSEMCEEFEISGMLLNKSAGAALP